MAEFIMPSMAKQESVEDLSEQIENLLEWTTIGQITQYDSKNIDLTKYKEVLVVCYANVTMSIVAHIPVSLFDMQRDWYGGYYISPTNFRTIQIQTNISGTNGTLIVAGSWKGSDLLGDYNTAIVYAR